MPTGERGFTYLLLLAVLAAGSATLAALGMQWRTALQRERELELIFRGEAIAAAIASYRAAAPGDQRWPRQLEDLIEDKREASMRRHLRRVYDDPFTGRPDWVTVPTEDGGFNAVHSRSDRPASPWFTSCRGEPILRPRWLTR